MWGYHAKVLLSIPYKNQTSSSVSRSYRTAVFLSSLPLPPLPLNPRDTHEYLLVPNRQPAREYFHRVLKIRVQEDFPCAVYQCRGDSVEDV